ncbi:MAG: hypothetical protein H6Q90_3839 [Deltaproteobacteria bacterium]|nr:hypothetical protein [Deltaproteobacteria bacterium]
MLFVGKPCTLEIDVTVGKETKLEYLWARLVGHQGWAIGSGDSHVSQRMKFPELICHLMGEGILPAGSTTRFAAQFTLPPGTPPSHELRPAHARMLLQIRASIPWWFDGKYHYEFAVRVPAPAVVDRTPFAIRSTPMTAAADKPRIELSLASTRMIAGEVAVGSVALFHVDDRRAREVDLTLVPILTLFGRGRPRERRGAPLGITLTLPPGSAGTNVPFQLKLPDSLTPSFQTVSHQLSWWLVARSGSFFGGKVEVSVPLEIVDASATATMPRQTAAPRLGDERIATLFTRFAAAHGWRGGTIDDAEHEHLAGQFAIEREALGCELRLAYSYRGEAGTFLVSRIEHPSLGLGLSVTPSSSLRHVFFEDIEVDIAAWDRAHHVTARSSAQTIPLLQAVVPTLMKSGHLGALVGWDDGAIVFERPVSAVDESELLAMTRALEGLGTVISLSRQRIAPPPGLVAELDAWQRLARALGGSLSVGDLSIDGKLDGTSVELGLEFREDGQPTGVRVSVGEPEAASAELRHLALALPHPATDVLGDPMAEPLVEAVTRWPADYRELRVTDGVAGATYTLPTSDPVVVDAARVRALVDALRAVLLALDPGAGPYR